MIYNTVDDDEQRRLAVLGLPRALDGVPRLDNPDNVEVQDSEFTPQAGKQTFPVPETGSGAPVDFGGRVIPNDTGVMPRLDTEGAAPDPTTVDSKMSYISAPAQASGAVPVSLPQSPQMTRDLARADELSKGSGLDQFQQKHHILGGILRGLDIAGSVLAPNVAVQIPGTTLHHQLLEAENRNNLTSDIVNREREVQTGHQQAEAEREQAETGQIPSQIKEREAQTAKTEAETEALSRPQSTFQKMDDGSVVQLMTDRNTGQTTAHVVYKGDPKVETDLATLMVGGKPHSVLVNKKTGETIKDLGETKTQNGPQTMMIVPTPQGPQAVAIKPGQMVPQGAQTAQQYGGEGDKFDKDYVKPARDTEKSYQMFMDAYNNRNNAKTGAESMLALSTHLATTFGNVKGSRVTKDMIQEHLGARGVSDSALVAVQKLTNGDVLSPDQWDAFKDLISNSRRLSWQNATDEAKRKQLPINFLPQDLQGQATGGTGTAGGDFFSKFGGHRE